MNFPKKKANTILMQERGAQITKKKIRRIYWNNEAWHTEEA
jgi:hypothetical protein